MGTLRLRHAAQAVALSPDGKTIASAGGGLCLWEAATGKELPCERPLGMSTRSVVFSSDGKIVYSCNNTVYATDVQTGKLLDLPDLNGTETCNAALAISPDGKTLAQGTVKGVRLWDTADHKEVKRLSDPSSYTDIRYYDFIEDMTYSPDGRWLAYVSSWTMPPNDRDRNIQFVHVWDTKSQKEKHVFKVIVNELTAAGVFPR